MNVNGFRFWNVLYVPVKAEYDEVQGDSSDLVRGDTVEGEVLIIYRATGLAHNPVSNTK